MKFSVLFTGALGLAASTVKAFEFHWQGVFANGDEIVENGPSSVLFTGHPVYVTFSSVDNSVISSMGYTEGETHCLMEHNFISVYHSLDSEADNAGGVSANAARAYAFLGGKATFFGVLGDDAVADEFERNMGACGVNMKTIRRKGDLTSHKMSLITADGTSTALCHLGASDMVGPDDLNKSVMDEFDYVVFEAPMLASPDQFDFTKKLLAAAYTRGKKVITLLFGKRCVEKGDEFVLSIVEQSAYVAGSMDAISKLYGLKGEELADLLVEKTKGVHPQHDAVIVTMGMEGALIFLQGKVLYVPPVNSVDDSEKRVDVVDSTDADELFAGAALYGLLNGWCAAKAAKFGSTIVADVSSKFGTVIDESVRAKIDEIKNSTSDKL
ncbi:adenosine kinase [Babesia caballi]|uniref:Adenosine kinase n=1 Tax=Babesia caballi TaxID=5871 RepID=A0AAV4M2B1_BABCB|nr:adenosine kinase [Babesia caballi]